jgi:hypothetical protein
MGDVEMQVNFEVVGWWYAIKPEEGEEVLYRNDRLMLTVILHSVPPDMLSSLWDRRTSIAAAWEVIKRIRVGVQCVRKANIQQLRRDFSFLLWKEVESEKISRTTSPGLLPICELSVTTSPTLR